MSRVAVTLEKYSMFDSLSERLSHSLRSITGKARLTEENIQETMREVRMALLEADVALPVVKDFVEAVKERAVGQDVMKSLSPGQAFLRIVQTELETVMGSANEGLNLATTPPAVIMMAGLQGAGKTTTVAKLARLDVDLALTTNGATLALVAPALADAGLDRINVSLDTLHPARFVEMTRRDSLAAVIDGVRAAKAAGLDPVKVNVVAMAGVNEDELIDFAAFGRAEGVEVRFIEFMPLDADQAWKRSSVLTQADIVERISERFPLVAERRGHAPADRFAYVDGGGAPGSSHVGVIASVTEPFCGSCDRVRLTADGKLRSCLFAMTETDLRGLIRAGADDEALAAAIEGCVHGKWAGHRIDQVNFIRPSRSMSQLGG